MDHAPLKRYSPGILHPQVIRLQLIETFVSLLYTHTHTHTHTHKYHHHHHHHLALVARISLTLSRHSSLSSITLGRSSGQHPVSSHSCWMYVRAGRPAFARPCVGVHKSTSLMSSYLLLQQCPACPFMVDGESDNVRKPSWLSR